MTTRRRDRVLYIAAVVMIIGTVLWLLKYHHKDGGVIGGNPWPAAAVTSFVDQCVHDSGRLAHDPSPNPALADMETWCSCMADGVADQYRHPADFNALSADDQVAALDHASSSCNGS